jgi:transcriptional regulator with XRE-family HTH domain
MALAKLIGHKTQGHISNVEKGKATLSRNKIDIICKILKISETWLTSSPTTNS